MGPHICRDSRRKIDYLDIVFLPKSQRGCDEIVPEVTKRLAPGAIMTTDCWKAYPEAARQAQAVHYTVNHSKQFKTAEGIHTNSVEGELGKSNLGVLNISKMIRKDDFND